MGLNKEKVMPVVRRRIKGIKLSKSVKRAMAFMDVATRTAYKQAMMWAAHDAEELKRKAPKDKKD